MTAVHQGLTYGCAYGQGSEGALEYRAFRGEGVDIGRGYGTDSPVANAVMTELVRQKYKQIRSRHITASILKCS